MYYTSGPGGFGFVLVGRWFRSSRNTLSTRKTNLKGHVQSKTGSSMLNPNINMNTTRTFCDNGKKSSWERNQGLKYILYSELIDSDNYGLCFIFNERYHPLYQCAGKQLRLVVLGGSETIYEQCEVIVIEMNEDEEEIIDCNSLGLFGLDDISHPKNPPITIHI